MRVKAENSATQREDAAGWEETYAQRVSTLSRNELTGYALAGVHETTEEFWALYTLEKEVFRRSLDEKASRFGEWLEREAVALDGELADRRIQSAVERFARIRKEYEASYEGNPLMSGRSFAIPARYGEVSGKVESIVGRAELAAPAVWSFSLQQGPVGISLIDGRSKEKWKGPLSLTLENLMDARGGACRVETDAEGRLDLDRAFRECGMRAGMWRIGWTGAKGRAVYADVRAEWKRLDLGLLVRSEGVSGHVETIARIKESLAGIRNSAFRVVPGNEALPCLEVRLKEVSQDSLDGMHFATLRAEISIPGTYESRVVRGKSGHADKERARARAIADFVKTLEGFPGPIFRPASD